MGHRFGHRDDESKKLNIFTSYDHFSSENPFLFKCGMQQSFFLNLLVTQYCDVDSDNSVQRPASCCQGVNPFYSCRVIHQWRGMVRLYAGVNNERACAAPVFMPVKTA